MKSLPKAIFMASLMAATPAAAGPILYNDTDVATESALFQKVDSPARGDLLVVRPAAGASAAVRSELTAAGMQVVAYIPRGAFLVRVLAPEKTSQWLSPRSAPIAVTIQPAWKVQPDLYTIANIRPTVPVSLVIGLVEESETLQDIISTRGAQITSRCQTEGKHRLGVTVPAGQLLEFLHEVSAHRAVYTIEPGAGARLMNDNASPILQSGTSSAGRPVWDRGLHGQGQIIAVLDTGLDPDNCYHREADMSLPPTVEGTGTGTPDLSRRSVIIYNFLYSQDFNPGPSDWDSHNHGTWVAGNALGSHIDDPVARNLSNGMAPMAKLIVQDGGYATDNCADLPALQCPVVDLTPFLDQAISQGAHFHNNSWGDRENFVPQNLYTFPTADMDDATWRNPEFLIFCAAGNAGPGSGTVGSPSVGKNVVSVGATKSPSIFSGSSEDLASFSSRGPASDGRIKPDVTAPGQTQTAQNDGIVNSGNCGTGLPQGTSMSSPVAAGSAALVRQYFTEGWYPSGQKRAQDAFNPTAALIKATLMAGATDMTGAGGFPPTLNEGWGRIHLERSLHFEGDDRGLLIYDERVGFAEAGRPSFIRHFDLPEPAAERTRIMLVWSDYPADPAATLALVNDLDLTVLDLDRGTIYRGNHFDVLTGTTQPGGQPDRLNNVEGVFLPAGTTGRFAVQVTAETIVYGPQGFALAIAGVVREAEAPPLSGWTFR